MSSQETQINNLSNSMNQDDSNLVNSILNDINSSNMNRQQMPQQRQQMNEQAPMQQGTSSHQQPSPEQIKMMQQQQMAMRQQQIMQQQQMAQQQMEKNDKKINIINNDNSINDDFITKIKNDSKNIILVIILTFIFNLKQSDVLFKSIPFCFDDEGINIQGLLLKSLLIGILYYLIKSQLF